MTELLNLFPGVMEKHYFLHPETKEFWFHGSAVCKELGFENTSRSILMYTDEDERFQEIYEGRTVWFVSEAGCYGLAMASKKENAIKFKRWLKHDVLPKLKTQRLYVMQNNDESLSEYQKREKALVKENERLLLEQKYLKAWSPTLSIPKARLLDLINYTAHEYSPFLMSGGGKSRQLADPYHKSRFNNAQLEGQILFDLVDTLFTGEKITPSNYGLKTAEGLQKKLHYKLFRLLQLSRNGQYQKLKPDYAHLENSVILKKQNNYWMWLEYNPEKKQQLESYLYETEDLAVS